jgi:SRSO17 transposase
MRAMGRGEAQAEDRFSEYVHRLGEAIGHADRHEPLRAYLTGLLLSGERKSVEPMAARIEPRRVGARHQSMHHFVAKAPWEDRPVLSAARDYALSQLERHAPVGAWIVDDTGIPKKGKHSVGVARQYCGALGKQDNCQVAVTVSLANSTMSVPCAWRLYLPEEWAADRRRRKAADIPAELRFQKKWQIALEEIDRLVADDLPRAPVVADAGYGSATEFREGVTARGLSYAVGIMKETTVWPEGVAPPTPAPSSGRGRPAKLLRRSPHHRPLSVLHVARQLPDSAWKLVRWREGTQGTMQSRFALTRVRPAHRDYWRSTPRAEEWLVIEWPKGESEPTKYWLSTAPRTAPAEDLIRLIKLRWRIERDYEEMKDELGLDHYEGRGWRGFHHHGVLCMAAYSFLAAERARLSPPQPLAFLRASRLPKGFRPRGASLAS